MTGRFKATHQHSVLAPANQQLTTSRPRILFRNGTGFAEIATMICGITLAILHKPDAARPAMAGSIMFGISVGSR